MNRREERPQIITLGGSLGQVTRRKHASDRGHRKKGMDAKPGCAGCWPRGRHHRCFLAAQCLGERWGRFRGSWAREGRRFGGQDVELSLRVL